MLQRALVIIPTYNESKNLPRLVPSVLSRDPRLEILVVDDGSPDGTGALADEIAAAEPRLHVMHREAKLGLGTAYLAGFRWGLEQGYDVLFEMDADFSHDPVHLPQFLEAIDLSQVESNGYAFQIEMNFRAWKKGFRLGEIPIMFVDRDVGESKMSKKIVREAVWRVWRLRILALMGRLERRTARA